ncbi:hypothetical protein HK405_014509, partial [Cladochytrium tenue]
MRLVRSSLPPHQAVFRVPPSLNKVDVQALLSALYGIDVTDVRTMNYLGRQRRNRRTSRLEAGPAFKKVVVTMREDFSFPPPVSTARDGALPVPPRIPPGASRFYRHLLPLPKVEEDPEKAAEAA